jgi:hypothetical protein
MGLWQAITARVFSLAAGEPGRSQGEVEGTGSSERESKGIRGHSTRGRSSVGLESCPVTQVGAGSSPVAPTSYLLLWLGGYVL